ncbi:ThiF family adenylyltransferase [Aeoliella mucimassa]|uniref:Putative adenylyltransferase/sulfurtransferase MoeZ n=1 Tax=Aeoliella mucimassa TaxID=2527972 RepID=A0A518ATD3_9BACT|nr:ThiF family adenylyltransferase [Aeoliella mucimassa]QDU57993.1 putative adenylyltransferase/sulfurtransferase MoeZ [Aeoliella mucimassa]
MPEPLDRYSKQMRFAPLGREGQVKLGSARVLVVGCGALGSSLADTLVRAGVGHVRIVDRDFLELSNLQRQVLYDEHDVASGLPKAIAAANKLGAINSQVVVEPFVEDVTYKNIDRLADDCDVIVDGTDNFEVRFLLNDYSLSANKPWVYGGVIGAEGQSMTILPGETACLACLLPEPPPPGVTPTCDTAGVLGPAVSMVAAIQSAEVLKLLSGNRHAINRKLTIVDLWQNTLRQVSLEKLHAAGDCRACGQRDFAWLEGRRGSTTAVLCGRNAVQLRPDSPQQLNLEALADQLESVADVLCNPYLLRAETGRFTLTLFPDGRAIIAGTDDVAEARTFFAQMIGN